MKKINLLMFFTSLLLVAACNQSTRYNLAYRFEPGQVYEVYSHTTSTMDQETMGIKINTENIQEFWIDWEVSSVDKDSIYDIQNIYRRIISDVKSNDSSMRFDSDQPMEDISEANLPQFYMVGKSIDIRLAKNGSIKEVKGIQEMMSEIMQDDLRGNPAVRLMLNKFSDESMKSSLAQYQIFPDKPVKIGESWKNSYTMDMFITFESENEYKLESVDGDEARIAVKGLVKTTKSKSNDITGLLGSMMEIDGDSEGFFVVNLKTGEIKNSELLTDMKASINMMGMKMPMNMKSKTLYKIVRKQ